MLVGREIAAPLIVITRNCKKQMFVLVVSIMELNVVFENVRTLRLTN